MYLTVLIAATLATHLLGLLHTFWVFHRVHKAIVAAGSELNPPKGDTLVQGLRFMYTVTVYALVSGTGVVIHNFLGDKKAYEFDVGAAAVTLDSLRKANQLTAQEAGKAFGYVTTDLLTRYTT